MDGGEIAVTEPPTICSSSPMALLSPITTYYGNKPRSLNPRAGTPFKVFLSNFPRRKQKQQQQKQQLQEPEEFGLPFINICDSLFDDITINSAGSFELQELESLALLALLPSEQLASSRSPQPMVRPYQLDAAITDFHLVVLLPDLPILPR